ncbi:MAG TPA: ABC transporter substrate-binding protein [Azospirillum sp.]|nr:ABC transporter substrate-binding protein [Azospirillum sp.]
MTTATAPFPISRRGLLAGSAAGFAMMTAPGLIRPAHAQAETIRVGFPVPLTGPFSAEAKDQVRAAELAVRQFNDAGGLNGRKAELLVRDDTLKPAVAAQVTLELIEKERVHFLVGSLGASVQLAINEVAKARGVLFNSISQSDAINEAKDFSRFTFHEGLTPHVTTGAVARHVFKPGQKVAFLTADYAFGHEAVRGFRRAGEKAGIVVLDDVRHPFGTADFSAYTEKIATLKPDVLCVCNFGKDQLNAIQALSDEGLKETFRIVVPVLLYNQCVAGGPDLYEGVVGGCNYHWTLEETLPSARAFNDAYRAANGGAVPSDYGAYGYGGVRTVLEAVKRAGSTDTDKVIAEMERLRYDFYKGPQHFRACDHQSVQSVLVVSARKKAAMRNPQDIFEILATDQPDEANLRTCSELGLST